MRRLAALTGCCLAISACGASESLKQFRARTASICGRAQTRAARIPPPQNLKSSATFLNRGIAVLVPELTRLRALRPPHEAASDYRDALSAFDHKLRALESTSHALARGADPTTAVKTLEAQLGPLEAQEDQAWRTLGVSACVNH